MSEPNNTITTAAQTVNTTILKTAIEAIPLLTNNNYTLWKNRVENLLDLQDLRVALTSSTGVLSSLEDVQLQTILTSKLESSIYTNVITHDNEQSAQNIWKSISEHFASSQASNCTRVFNAVLHVQFNPNYVQDLITQVKTSISRLHEVGIDLPKDIIPYLILHKLPASMTDISQQITHSDKPITAKLVLDHLRLYANDQQLLANSGAFSKLASVSLLTDDSKKMKKRAKQAPVHIHRPLQTRPCKDKLWRRIVEIKGIGTIKLSHENGNLFLHNFLFVPNLVVNLLSVGCLVLDDFNVQFLKNSFSISRNNNLLITGRYEGNLPCLTFLNLKEKSYLSAAEVLHKSMGHVSYHRLRQKLGIPLKNFGKCKACALGKITKASFKFKHQRAKRPFEELHLDLIGPITPISREGERYILTVVESNTRYCSAIPITQKSNVYNTLATILNFEAKRFGYYPSILHSDRGGELLNSSMKEYCREHLIKQRYADPYTPQQNGLAEQHNRTIIESLRTILTDSKLSRRHWSDVFKVSTLTLNQIPSHRSSKSPYKRFRGRTIPLDFFHPIGNPVSFLNEPKKSGSKLYPKGLKEDWLTQKVSSFLNSSQRRNLITWTMKRNSRSFMTELKLKIRLKLRKNSWNTLKASSSSDEEISELLVPTTSTQPSNWRSVFFQKGNQI
ncbi:hypothetical protein VP01_3598g1 [Puccinia sorghi]|uniref:Integrase catalytic domain-containing protein n=1 Tax=Puccinia sorghi TaxID=27349 RepID=A0A0L6UV41_9BASI|nr:hypothetical protein VP01_3598g1 [Puccinia sorghi]